MATTAALVIHHEGIAITYDEGRDLFTFELRGRQRTATSIRKAKEAIDAPPPKDKKPFTRFQAWVNSHWDGWQRVDVTSIGEPTCFGEARDVWVVDKNKRRTRERQDKIYPCSPHNDALAAQWMDLDAQVKKLEDQKRAIQKRMKSYEIPPE